MIRRSIAMRVFDPERAVGPLRKLIFRLHLERNELPLNVSHCQRTAELLVEIMDRDDKNGPYFLVALLYDSQYGHEDLGKLLPHLKEQPRGLVRGVTSR